MGAWRSASGGLGGLKLIGEGGCLEIVRGQKYFEAAKVGER